LPAELVAGETEDLEVVAVTGFEGFIDLLQAFVLRGETTFGGGVDDEEDFAFVFGEGDGFASFCGAVSLML